MCFGATFRDLSYEAISTNRGVWATRWSDGKVGGGAYMCGRGLGSIWGEWLAFRVTLGKVSGTTRGTATRRTRSSDRHLTLFLSSHWLVGHQSRKTPRIWATSKSALGKSDPMLRRAYFTKKRRAAPGCRFSFS